MVEYMSLTNHGPHYWYVKYTFGYDGSLWIDFLNDGTVVSEIPEDRALSLRGLKDD